MPHGALDVMMISRLIQQRESNSPSALGVNYSYWFRLCGYCLLYTAVAGLAFGFWLLFPSTALVFF